MSIRLEGDKFASLTTKRPRFYTSEGSTEKNDYEIQIDKKGHKVLKCVGSHDIYEEIQSYAEECKIENIIARAAAGDPNALNARAGFYADITQTPENLAEAQNAILKLSKGFEELPPEIRAKFDNSKEKFVNEFGNESWFEKMGFKAEQAETTEQQNFIPENKTEVLTPEGN